MRTLPFTLVAFMLLGAFPVFVPGAEAATEQDMVAADGSGDVVVVTPSEATQNSLEATVVPLLDGFKFVDLTEARIYGETPTEFSIGFSVLDFTKVGAHPNTAVYVVCFRWEETGAWFRLWVQLQYPLGQAAVEPMLGDLDVYRSFAQIKDAADCDINTFKGSADEGEMDFTVLQPVIDLAKNTFDLRIPRLEMERMGAQGEPARPIPKAGHSFTDLMAKATSKTGSSAYHSFDEIPAYTAKKFAFLTDTGNSELRVLVRENIHAASAGVQSSGGVPIYGVEIGSFQTVPLTIENRLGEPLNVQLTAEIREPQGIQTWQTRIIPSVPLKAAVDGVPSEETVTLIVNTKSEVVHKERVRVLVTARDERFPDLLGAGLVDILAVKPPSKTEKTVYFHTTGLTCNTADHWINTLQTDNKAVATQVLMNSCDAAGGGGTAQATAASIAFYPDVPFARDYRLSVSDPATGKVSLKAVARVPGQQAEAPANMVADVTVSLYSGGSVIGETTLHNQAIQSTATSLPFQIPIEAPILGAQAREVPNDRPLSVRVAVQKLQRTYIVGCESPCPHEEEFSVPDPSTVAGNIFLVTDGSEVTLPILDSTRSGDLVNITASGALITLRLAQLDAERSRFANPGKAVVFNVTVRNEGVNRDTAQIEVKVNQTGWKWEIFPTDTYALGVAEAMSFNVKVTPPEVVREGMVAGVTVVATSKVDKEATATLPLRVEITRGEIFEDEKETFEKLEEKKDSPSVGFVPLLAVAALAALFVRRRRL